MSKSAVDKAAFDEVAFINLIYNFDKFGKNDKAVISTIA